MKRCIWIGLFVASFALTACDGNEKNTVQTKPQIEQLALNSVAEKVNFSAGYNQCMEFYKLSKTQESRAYFNLASLSNGYIDGIMNGSSEDSLKHATILNESFPGMQPDTSKYSIEDLSFSYGYVEAQKQLKFFSEINFDLKKEYIKNGYTIAAVGQAPPMSQEQMNTVLTSYITDVTSKTYTNFLEENKKRDVVTTTPSGLQYEVVELGEGSNPILGQQVTFHLKGMHHTGEEFLNSRMSNNNEPITTGLPYSGVPAINEGLLLMNKGSKYRFYAPALLAYGSKGFMNPNKSFYIIKPNEPVLYEIELVDIQ